MYRYTTQISFDQCDPAGIIFYSRAFDLAHRAFEQLVLAAGIAWDDWFASEAFVVPIVHGEVDYQSPLRPGHEIVVEATVAQIGNTSVTFAYRIFRGETLCATLETVHVFMDRDKQTKVKVPEAIRERLARMQDGCGS